MTRSGFPVQLKFAIVGIANSLVGLTAIFLCKGLFGLGDALANFCGYVIGLAVSFALNRGWTFQHAGRVFPAIARFLTVFGLAYLLNLVTVLVSIHSFRIDAYLSQAIGVVPYTVLFYIGSRYFAFRSSARAKLWHGC
jgi:putative flippase GtrA